VKRTARTTEVRSRSLTWALRFRDWRRLAARCLGSFLMVAAIMMLFGLLPDEFYMVWAGLIVAVAAVLFLVLTLILERLPFARRVLSAHGDVMRDRVSRAARARR